MHKIEIIGNGSIHPLDGKPRYRCRKWQIRVQCIEDGVQKTKSRTFPSAREKRAGVSGTMRQAEEALAQFIGEIEIDSNVKKSENGITFSEYSDLWQKRRTESGDYAERTLKVQSYALASVSHLIGGMQLSDIDATAIEGVYARLRSGNTLSGRLLAGTTIAQVYRAVVGMFRYAESHGDVPPGLLRELKMPKKNDVDRRALSDEEANRLLDYIEADLHPWSVMASLCLSCGLRRSEALGARWSDIDDGVIKIRRSLDEHAIPKSPKSKSGSRDIPIPERERSILDSWRKIQGLLDDGAICSWDGSYSSPSSATVWWQRKCGTLA